MRKERRKKNRIISHGPVKMGARKSESMNERVSVYRQQYDFTLFSPIFFYIFISVPVGIHIHYKLILGRLRMNESIFLGVGVGRAREERGCVRLRKNRQSSSIRRGEHTHKKRLVHKNECAHRSGSGIK